MVSDGKVVFWVLPEDFFVSLKGRLFFVLEVQTSIKLMEKLVFHQPISFHLLYFFFCGLTCLETKNNLFPFFLFVILAHLEKPKKHK